MSSTSKILSLSLLSAGIALSAGQAFGHPGFQTFPDGSPPRYLEGRTVFPTVIIPHDCSEGGRHFPTVGVVVMPPRGHTLNRIARPVAGQPVQVLENALAWAWGAAMPSMTAGFGRVQTRSGPIHPTGEGTRALAWDRGRLPGTQYGAFTFRARTSWKWGKPLFPERACVNEAVYYMPVVQYCTAGRLSAWLLEKTPAFPVLGDVAGFSARVTVARDTATNPLPEGCTAPETWHFYPDAKDIDQFMLQRWRPAAPHHHPHPPVHRH